MVGGASNNNRMIGVLAAWAFGSFIYFKVAFDAAFRSGITITASLLLAIALTGVIFVGSGTYAMRLLPYNWAPEKSPVRYSTLVAKTAWPFVGYMIAFLLTARLIVFGFAKELNQRISFVDYRGRITDELFWFAIIVVASVFSHYLTVLVGTYLNANRQPVSHRDAVESSPATANSSDTGKVVVDTGQIGTRPYSRFADGTVIVETYLGPKTFASLEEAAAWSVTDGL